MNDMVKTTYNLPTPYIRNSRIAALKLALSTLCHHIGEVVWGDYEIVTMASLIKTGLQSQKFIMMSVVVIIPASEN